MKYLSEYKIDEIERKYGIIGNRNKKSLAIIELNNIEEYEKFECSIEKNFSIRNRIEDVSQSDYELVKFLIINIQKGIAILDYGSVLKKMSIFIPNGFFENEPIKVDEYLQYRKIFSKCRFVLFKNTKDKKYILENFPINEDKLWNFNLLINREENLNKYIEINEKITLIDMKKIDFKKRDIAQLEFEKNRILNKFKMDSLTELLDLELNDIDRNIRWKTMQLVNIYEAMKYIIQLKGES